MRYVLVGVCLVSMVRVVAAQDRGTNVRAESADIRRLIGDIAAKSTSFRALIERVDASDVIVYVRAHVLASQLLDGRIGFLGAHGGRRFFAIELACPRPRETQMTTLAHELQHAVEIANAPWVDDSRTLAAYYQRIGVRLAGDAATATYETDAAQRMGRRVRDELQKSSGIARGAARSPAATKE